MSVDRKLAISALILAFLSLGIGDASLRRDPLGSSLSEYDLSSPEQTLKSMHQMAIRRDLRAGIDYLQANISRDPSPSTKLFSASPIEITVVKSIEIEGSAAPKCNGIVVSFVNYRIAGVDYHDVQYFRKDGMGRFMTGETYYLPYGVEPTDRDKTLKASIDAFNSTGKF